MHAPLIAAINRLKKERDAVILAHNYQTPEIFNGVADIKGDSLALAREAQRTSASVIVLCGVHFMAETAKLLNPEKTVLLPDLEAGCSLASSITAADVRALRATHPGVPVVTYVNTSAAVKAESDVCCTSANALAIVEALPGDRVIFIPDEYLAELGREPDHQGDHLAGRATARCTSGSPGPRSATTASGTPAWWCWRIRSARPTCWTEADFVGSTSKMSQWVGDRKPGARPARHRVLDERQRRGRSSRARVRAAVQLLPAHEADHAAQDPALARDHDPSHRDRPRRRRARRALGRADARDERHRAGRDRRRRAHAGRRRRPTPPTPTEARDGNAKRGRHRSRRRSRRPARGARARAAARGAGDQDHARRRRVEPLRAGRHRRRDRPRRLAAPARRRHARGRRRAQRSRHRARADRARAGRDRAPGRRRHALRPRTRRLARARARGRASAPPHRPRRRRRHRLGDGPLALGGGGAPARRRHPRALLRRGAGGRRRPRHRRASSMPAAAGRACASRRPR